MCITLSLCGYCPGTRRQFLLWALPLLCVSACTPFLSTCSSGRRWVGGRHPGRGAGMCAHTQPKGIGCIHFPGKPFFLGINTSHLPERVWSPSRLFIYLFILSTPSQKEELPVLKCHCLRRSHCVGGDSWGVWTDDSMITAPETRTRALFLRGTHTVTEHHRVHFPGLWALLWAGPGPSQSVHPFFPYSSWVTNVSFREFQDNNK